MAKSQIFTTFILLFSFVSTYAFVHPTKCKVQKHRQLSMNALSNYFENDLVTIMRDEKQVLYVVRPDTTLSPLCTHEDDNETDLYVYPRAEDYVEVEEEDIVKCYGEGWYSQRVVPSLGGGPGYGAEADDVWSIEGDVLEALNSDGVEIPNLDLGMAHGEKARAGAI